MGSLLDRLKDNKPWAVLGITRRRYETAKPWKKAGMTRPAFERWVLELPPEVFQVLKENAEAETLVEAIFGKGAGG